MRCSKAELVSFILTYQEEEAEFNKQLEALSSRYSAMSATISALNKKIDNLIGSHVRINEFYSEMDKEAELLGRPRQKETYQGEVIQLLAITGLQQLNQG